MPRLDVALHLEERAGAADVQFVLDAALSHAEVVAFHVALKELRTVHHVDRRLGTAALVVAHAELVVHLEDAAQDVQRRVGLGSRVVEVVIAHDDLLRVDVAVADRHRGTRDAVAADRGRVAVVAPDHEVRREVRLAARDLQLAGRFLARVGRGARADPNFVIGDPHHLAGNAPAHLSVGDQEGAMPPRRLAVRVDHARQRRRIAAQPLGARRIPDDVESGPRERERAGAGLQEVARDLRDRRRQREVVIQLQVDGEAVAGVENERTVDRHVRPRVVEGAAPERPGLPGADGGRRARVGEG